jgi:glucokinase
MGRFVVPVFPAANMALKIMATGGIYLAEVSLYTSFAQLRSRVFLETFKRKGRFIHFMERIPVHLILNRAALVGSAAYGLESFTEES